MTTDLPPARILDVTPAEYHKLPGFSSTIAKQLISTCAMKARDAYERRLEKIAAEDDSEDEPVTPEKQAQLDRGSVLHALSLGRGAERIKVIPDALLSGKDRSYSSAEAKAARDDARRAGLIPVKEPKMPGLQASADAIKARLAAAGHVLDGLSEVAIEWHEATPHGPVLCRSMLDHVVMWGHGAAPGGLEPSLTPTGALIYDLKIVADANPDRNERSAENLGYAIQACAYERALTALYPRLGGRIQFRFLFIEPRRPFLLWDPERLSGPFREIGERRWRRAVNTWGDGMATGHWPDYRTPDRVEITAPMWTLKAEGFTDAEL